tara:strand:- start:203518 stop:204156 length:639 start_codon:yes stop_codon:yes gene_type:complete
VQLLLVEDHQPSAHRLSEALSQLDKQYVITHVNTVASALEALESGKVFDAALVDLGLQHARSLEASARLCENFPDLVVVALTGKTDARLASAIICLSAPEFLLKGEHDVDAIDRALRCALELGRGEQSLKMAANRDELTGRLNRRGCQGEVDKDPLGKLSHEICNQLNVVALEADVIQLAVGNGRVAEVDQSIASIHQKCDQLASLVRQLLR